MLVLDISLLWKGDESGEWTRPFSIDVIRIEKGRTMRISFLDATSAKFVQVVTLESALMGIACSTVALAAS